jgi:Flp pilus assembly protein TadG
MVELALVAPILLVLIVGRAQIGSIVYEGVSVATAAQEGARVASEQPINSAAYPTS